MNNNEKLPAIGCNFFAILEFNDVGKDKQVKDKAVMLILKILCEWSNISSG